MRRADPALRREIDALLGADRTSTSCFSEPPDLTDGGFFGESGDGQEDRLPEQIGAFRVVSVLGQGGMGVVYLGEQTEPIKLVRLGMDSRQIVARFNSERQALALMNHANIARVLEAGEAEGQGPYFVMEFVEDGVPITKYCDEHELNVRQRLEVLLPICDAIQHAHQRAIIHRDIKPSNILLTTQDGTIVPKVIDFGIAKAMDEAADCETTEMTQTGQVIGTPGYMSPEQADNRPVDTRTDVYSLGVLLYELLVGALPLDLASMAGRVAVRIGTALERAGGRWGGAVEVEKLQQEDDVRDVERSVIVVRVRRFRACRSRAAKEEMKQQRERIDDVNSAVAVDVATNRRRAP